MSVTHVPADLRRLVRERAGFRCEYCLIPETDVFYSLHVDHIIAEKHGRTESGYAERQPAGTANGRGSIWTSDRSRALSVLD